MAASATLQLRVAPGASRAGVVGRHGDGWKVRVVAAPERGRANDAVIRLLADVLGLSAGDVAIVAGHGGRDKIVTLTGIDSDEAARRLASAASSPGKSAS
jgi:uncharacterized protein (TIGR00251 family)